MDAIVLRPGEGDALDVGPVRTLFKATGDTTGGLLTLSETTLPPGSPAPPLHTHEKMQDNFYVLEGTLTLHLRDEMVEAPQGTFASLPPGVAHTFSNPSGAPVRFLNLNAPGGLRGLPTRPGRRDPRGRGARSRPTCEGVRRPRRAPRLMPRAPQRRRRSHIWIDPSAR